MREDLKINHRLLYLFVLHLTLQPCSLFAGPLGAGTAPLFCSFSGAGQYTCDCTAAALPGRTVNGSVVECVPCVHVTAANLPYVASPIAAHGGTIDLWV